MCARAGVGLVGSVWVVAAVALALQGVSLERGDGPRVERVVEEDGQNGEKCLARSPQHIQGTLTAPGTMGIVL